MADKRKVAGSKKPVVKKKAANGYVKSAPIKAGMVLTDSHKNKWIVGPAIGSGGFGDIYSAAPADGGKKSFDQYTYVVKIEPHENGPLFVEMHFYMRNAKQSDIQRFQKSKGLKSLGMPHFVASGSADIDGNKHRFVVMPRYGKDIWNIFLSNERKLPTHTVLRLAIQMLDVLQYIHECTYVHADIKGANILLGFGKGGEAQAYLVDFGLASHYTTKDYKPDPKKMHNGTIEYTSRDAHNGVPTMRGDLEILGYNLIHWLGGNFPWESHLDKPTKVQELKESFMQNIEKSIKSSLSNVPASVLQLMKCVGALKYNETPDYEKLKKYFEVDIRICGKSNSGNLEFNLSKEIKQSPIKAIKPPTPQRKTTPQRNPENRNASKTRKRANTKDMEDVKSEDVINDGKKIHITKAQEKVENKIGDKIGTSKSKIVVNNNIKNTGKIKKVYELNVELDLSMDANVIINVNRKRKSRSSTPRNKKENEEESEKDETDGDNNEDVIPESPNSTPSVSKRQRVRTPKVSIKTSTRIGKKK